jgi:putative glutamine amidotransferase
VSRPLIGICAALERARWGPWDTHVLLVPRNYVTAVQEAGGLALMLPPDERTAESPDELLDLLDGVLLAGGLDVDPASYGERPHPQTTATSPERDRFELGLARMALDRDLPLLGICRGMQVLNVAAGGTLIQHLPDTLGHDDHRHAPGAFTDHDVRLEPESRVARALEVEHTSVKSHHHQGLADRGEGVEASGWAVRDGLVEAVELPERRFALGVLWHPEEEERNRLVESFVAEARAGVAAR